jgi:hypothetical protein
VVLPHRAAVAAKWAEKTQHPRACVYTLVYVLCRIVETNCNDVQRQSSRDKMKDNKSIVSYWNMKQKWGRELCIDRCNLTANVG